MNMDKISIIVPVYKVEKYLHRCIDSILTQTYQNIEVILVDDGSPDDCGRICDQYAEQDARIKVIHKHNEGVSMARNDGMRMASGQYLVFVDADDYLDKTYIQILLSYMDQDVDIVASDFVGKNERDKKRKRNQKILLDESYDFSARYSHFTACGAMFRKDVVGNITFENNIYVGEDTLFYSKVLRKCRAIQTIAEMLYYRVRREDSATAGGYTDKKYTEIEAWEKVCKEYAGFPKIQQTAYGEYAIRCLHMYLMMQAAGLENTDRAVYVLKQVKNYRKNGIIATKSIKGKLVYCMVCIHPTLYKFCKKVQKHYMC